MLLIISISNALAIQVPSNWVEMIIWYSILVLCLIAFIFVMKRRKNRKRNVELNDRIEILSKFKSGMMQEKAITRRNLYANIFQLNAIKDYCKQTYETSQFEVYNETASIIESILDGIKHLDLKNWKAEKNIELRTQMSEQSESAISYLQQAL